MMVYRMVWLLEKKMLHWILWFVIKNQYTSLNKQTGVEFTHRRHTHRIQWLVPGPINQCLSKQSSVDDFKLTLKLSLCTCSGASLSFPWDPSQPSCIPFDEPQNELSHFIQTIQQKQKSHFFAIILSWLIWLDVAHIKNDKNRSLYFCDLFSLKIKT